LGLGGHVTITLVRKGSRARADGDIVEVTEFLDAYPKKAVDAFRKGFEYRKQKKNEDAMKTFETAIHVAPGFYQADNQLGILYKEVGRNDDAENETYIAENPRGEQLKDVIEMRDQLLKAKETGQP